MITGIYLHFMRSSAVRGWGSWNSKWSCGWCWTLGWRMRSRCQYLMEQQWLHCVLSNPIPPQSNTIASHRSLGLGLWIHSSLASCTSAAQLVVVAMIRWSQFMGSCWLQFMGSCWLRFMGSCWLWFMGSCWSRVVDHTRRWWHTSERVSRRLRILEAVLKGEMTTRKLERVVVVAVFDIRRVYYGRGGWYQLRWVTSFINGVWFAMVFGYLYYPGICKYEEVVVSTGRRWYTPPFMRERRWSHRNTHSTCAGGGTTFEFLQEGRRHAAAWICHLWVSVIVVNHPDVGGAGTSLNIRQVPVIPVGVVEVIATILSYKTHHSLWLRH